MAASKPAPDPLTTIEAMWRGSITRLGQFFKDYKEYGPQTRTVLRGTSGKYRDALDDLETELLDVKWLLEQDLRGIRVKRDALKKATATPAPTKKKQELITGTRASDDSQQNPPKRQKTDHKRSVGDSQTQKRDFAENVPPKPSETTAAKQAARSIQAAVEEAQKNLSEKQIETRDKDSQDIPASTVAPATTENPDLSQKTSTEESDKPMPPDGAPSEGPMSADANDKTFDSIFGSPTGENGANEFTFNIGVAEDLATSSTQAEPLGESTNPAENPASLNSLLSGLESYANATNDDFTMLNPGQDTDKQGGSLTVQPTVDGNAFELPSLDDTNVFDAFLNSNDFPAPVNSEQKKDDLLNDDDMLNLGDIEDEWFN